MSMKACIAITAALLACANTARAQDDGISVSAGLKAWSTSWSGFTYTEVAGQPSLLTPVEAGSKLVTIPSLSVRWGSLVGSVSGYASTDFNFPSGTVSRQETDLNLGWLVTPGLALSAGYKRLSQRGAFRYEPAGPVLGASASAPLTGTLALYGNLGFGRLETPASRNNNDVQFKVDYQLGEVGLSWALPVDRFVGALHLTLGYRTQVIVSKDAGIGVQAGQDGRDLTQGFTLGLMARF
jgi:hypothetical protein